VRFRGEKYSIWVFNRKLAPVLLQTHTLLALSILVKGVTA